MENNKNYKNDYFEDLIDKDYQSNNNSTRINIKQNEIYTNKNLISDKIINEGDFSCDIYTCIHEVPSAVEEYLIFIVHGIGQNSEKLESTRNKIKKSLAEIYRKKSDLLKKQMHFRIIDWKTHLLEKEKDLMNNLVDRNNNTKYPKMFIGHVPLDLLHYLSNRNKFIILNDIIDQMNTYYDYVKKHRKLFKGNVSVAGHSLGSVMIFDILTNMTKNENFEFEVNHNEKAEDKSDKEDKEGEKGNTSENGEKGEKGKKGENKYYIFSHISEDVHDEGIEEGFKIYRKNRKDNLLLLVNKNKSGVGFVESTCNIQKEIDFEIEIENENERLGIKKIKYDLDNNNNKIPDLKSLYEDISINLDENITHPKIYSKNQYIKPINFQFDHFFLLGSPLSLILTVEHGANSYLKEMEIVKDFHNIIHPMDPVAYRLEPLIMNYPYTKHSFTLPHWENDGNKNILLLKLKRVFCCDYKDEAYLNHDKIVNKKRYDFMVQESMSEKAVNVIGFLFSHMAYWNNPDAFYFIVKTIHWQGYNHVTNYSGN